MTTERRDIKQVDIEVLPIVNENHSSGPDQSEQQTATFIHGSLLTKDIPTLILEGQGTGAETNYRNEPKTKAQTLQDILENASENFPPTVTTLAKQLNVSKSNISTLLSNLRKAESSNAINSRYMKGGIKGYWITPKEAVMQLKTPPTFVNKDDIKQERHQEPLQIRDQASDNLAMVLHDTPHLENLVILDEKEPHVVEVLSKTSEPVTNDITVLELFLLKPTPTEKQFAELMLKIGSLQHPIVKALLRESTGYTTNYIELLLSSLAKKLHTGILQSKVISGHSKGYWIGTAEVQVENSNLLPSEKPKTTPEKPKMKIAPTLSEIEEENEKRLEEIPDRIQRNVQLKKDVKNNSMPRILSTPMEGSRGKYNVQIYIPGKGSTSQLQFITAELELLAKIMGSNIPYTRDRLELHLTNTRSEIFDSFGGYEKVIESLNEKIKSWKIQIVVDQDQLVKLQPYKGVIQRILPLDRRDVNFGRYEGKLRKRQASHRNVRL